MIKKWSIIFVGLFSVVQLFGQQDTVVLSPLDVTNYRLQLQNKTQNIYTLSDSVIAQNGNSLTELLRHNSAIYFKENGWGMVSSPSFRGTTAQQTTVLWNGIAINSKSLGQTDFNAVMASNYQEIKVKPGGGSVIYGSGAIGGSIHLQNQFDFNEKFHLQLKGKYGSFNTQEYEARAAFSTQKWSGNASLSRYSSDNDYKVKPLDFENINGNLYRKSAHWNLAYRPNLRHQIAFYSQWYEDERHFSLVEPTANKTKYQNRNIRTLAQWNYKSTRFKSELSAAFLSDRYRYFEVLDEAAESQGEINSFVAKYDAIYQFSPQMSLSFLESVTYSKMTGAGSGIDRAERVNAYGALLYTYQVLPNLYGEAGLRAEFSKDYRSPILFSAGLNFAPFSFYQIKLNVSRNFRMPTFNDLYWQPGGNLDLKAESSLQYELSKVLKLKKTEIGASVYYNTIKDMIRWVPTSLGYWSPVNTNEVTSQGFELYAHTRFSLGADSQLKLHTNYSYTSSVNQETGLQLVYVPKNKVNTHLSFFYKHARVFAQLLYVGRVYTQEDNNPETQVDEYALLNAGVGFIFGKKYKIAIDLKVNNISNTVYQNILYRPMPMRNYMIGLNLKI